MPLPEKNSLPTHEEVLLAADQIFDQAFAKWLIGFYPEQDEDEIHYSTRLSQESKLDTEQVVAVGTLQPGAIFKYVLPNVTYLLPENFNVRPYFELKEFEFQKIVTDKRKQQWVVAKNLKTQEIKSLYPNMPVLILDPNKIEAPSTNSGND